MSNKYEKFDNEFVLLPAEHENVNINKQKNGSIRTSLESTETQLKDHFSDDKCAVEIITNCNGKKPSNQCQSDNTTNLSRQLTLKSYNEFDTTNVQKLSPNQRKLRFYFEQIWFRLLSILIIITYCILTIYDVFIESKHNYTPRTFDPTSFNHINYITSFMTTYFVIDVCLRIFASGSITSFFANWYNSLDWSIIIIEFLILLIGHMILLPRSIGLVCLGRLVRIYVLINLLRENGKNVLLKPFSNETADQKNNQINVDLTKNDEKEATIVNSQANIDSIISTSNNIETDRTSKVKRLITPEDFKLDISYIKDNLIVLPCPVDNIFKFKRNQIKKLESFLDIKYGSAYKVYNLCSEQSYMNKSRSKYFHGNYLNFFFEDHGILTLNMIKEFVISLDNYLNSDSKAVAVIHCEDGKKRTSFVVCAWLLYKKYFDNLKDAQRFFYEKLNLNKSRSNSLELNPTNYNLLQTPSQSRYLNYFLQLIKANMERPKERILHLSEMRVSSLIGVGQGNGSDLYCVFQINQFEQFHMNFFQENISNQYNTNLNCRSNYNSEQDILTIFPINCPPLTGDILVRFFCRSNSVPKSHQHCAFYFWFNTNYLNETQISTLRFDRSELDNAHEPHLHTIYREKFSVELVFKG